MKAPNLLRVVLTSLGFIGFSASAHALSILVDFGAPANQTNHISLGGTDPTNYWNNVTSPTMSTPLALVDTTNSLTGISLVITSRFGSFNENGTTNSSAPFPTNATRDSFYGNTEEFSGLSDLTPKLAITGLDPSQAYSFRFYASRTGVSDIRTTDYFVTGGISGVATLDVANNISNTASVAGITPDIFGTIEIALVESATNTNGNSFVYLGTLEIIAVPEPGTAALLLMSGAAAFGAHRVGDINYFEVHTCAVLSDGAALPCHDYPPFPLHAARNLPVAIYQHSRGNRPLHRKQLYNRRDQTGPHDL